MLNEKEGGGGEWLSGRALLFKCEDWSSSIQKTMDVVARQAGVMAPVLPISDCGDLISRVR